LDTVRFWINAFIPNSVCELFGDTFGLRAPFPPNAIFAGDQRDFSNDPNASARMHSEVVIGDVSSDTPTIQSQTHICGETHRIDEAGNVLERATAAADRMRFLNLRGSQTVDPEGGVIDGIPNSIQIDFVGSAGNPLIGAPDIDYSGTLTIDRDGSHAIVKGAVNDFPAYEMYCSVDDGPALTLVQKNPVVPLDLFGEENRPLQGSASF